jgi:poly-gamma-glutamate capsule biosynthesis protein CapA/YwtB (metallophosphatase superfamily)
MLGRQLNQALVDPAAADRVLGSLAVLRTADLALCNGEGVISTGGYLVAKGEPAPHTWRARPEVVGLFARAGIDVLAMGNNHAGDYGPEAEREGIQHLRTAGLDAAGIGLNSREARTPVYRRVGDTVVAIVGVDLTDVRSYRATAEQAGSLALDAEDPKRQDDVVARLDAIEDEARKYAHVVLLSPHWGPNWRTEPLPIVRKLAARLLAAGYDGILGHSAHTLQGVEIVDGKPVIYDAGNLSITYDADDAAHRGMLYEIAFTRAGITGLQAWPLSVQKNRTTIAEGRLAAKILGEWDGCTTALGTPFSAEGNSRRIGADPGGFAGPWGTPDPPVRTAAAVEPAPAEHYVDALPADATPAAVQWRNGVALVGYHLLVPSVGAAKASQVVTLYLRATRPQGRALLVQLRAFNAEDQDTESHGPADWAVRGDEWQTGKLLVDQVLFSFDVPPEPGVAFSVCLGGAPTESDLPVVDDCAVLGKARYDAAAPKIAEILRASR